MAADDREREEQPKEELVSGFEVGVRVFFVKYGSYLLLAAAMCLLGWQVWNYYQKKKEVAVQEAWYQLGAALGSTDNTAEKLHEVIEQQDVKEVQGQAWVTLGNLYLTSVALGVSPTSGTPFNSEEQLAKAEDAYRHAADGFGSDPMVEGPALLGLAAVAEDRRNWEDAAKQYKAVTEGAGLAKSAYANLAAERLATLDERKNAPRLAMTMAPRPAAPAGLNLPGMSIPGLQGLPPVESVPGGGTFSFPGGMTVTNPGASTQGSGGGGGSIMVQPATSGPGVEVPTGPGMGPVAIPPAPASGPAGTQPR